MTGGIVTVASGVMNPLIGKLTALMGDEYNKFKGVKKQASFLQKELSAMNAALQKLELMDDELDPTVKDWRDDVREMSYDMENCVDDFMRQSRADDAKSGFIKITARRIKKLRQRLRIAHRMEELKTLAIEANARRQRYKVDDWKPASGSVDVDPRLRAVYQEADSLIAIDGPREEVATRLMDAQNKLKVVSVVGSGGLGKTTLAKQVYDKIGSQFNCKAFFSVSQRPDMTELLNNLQYKLGMKKPDTSHTRKVDDIIQEIRQHLKNNRYLIVVDDVWDESAWYIIKCVFPEEGNGSRVIVTTRVEVVAGAACQNDREGIYKLEPLSEENSRMLLLNRVFGSEHGCPPQLEQVMTEILKKCHGLPLAIITIGSLLACQERSRKGWESIRDSLGAHSATNPSLEEMKSILNLSYMHLPAYLRACFLYLGMYVEDYVISRDDLVRQWIAEGLVGNLHGQDLEAVGRNYFNELINRSMIQPWQTEYGEVLYCKVHDLMLDLILSKCDRNNFLSVAYSYEGMARLHGSKYKVRRLSLSSMAGGGATYDPTITVNLSQVRSFTLLGKSMPPLVLFKYLRVLRIDQGSVGEDEGTLDLTAISQLFELRYLYLRGPEFVQLPAELQGLVYLETLHIHSELKSIPSDIVHLSRLSYLYILYCNHELLSEWIGNMKSLNSLRMPLGIRNGQRELNGMNGIIGLGELTNLRDLTISLWSLEEPELNALICSTGKLRNLKHLQFYGSFTEIHSQMGSLSNPFQHIEKIDAYAFNFRRVPIWMGGLHCLRILSLRVEETSTDELRLLGELPFLVKLTFIPSHIPKERAILGTGLFPVLEYFHFWTEEDALAYLGFEAGAMPNLQTLSLQNRKWGGSTPVGMEHLLRLQKIHLYGVDSGDATIVSAFRNALSAHPNRPSIEKFW
ncbi:disease resistance protein RGA5 [Aegilops tauschii subsp. strangulata]|uniref:Disease resistance protein RPP13 n=1 Tax=Aegilops tauschii subsp. strangulata TaxID=200361 RepID=A0A453A3L0_AEGTS|nr:disease resistance protein RGA5 [Aegilops tauschii subsp. strangulata]